MVGITGSAAMINASKEESEWHRKCSRPNPTFATNTRARQHYCRDIESFFAHISNHTDLSLFEALDAMIPGDVPGEFVVRSQLAPAAQRKLRAHCLRYGANVNSSENSIGMLCRHALQLEDLPNIGLTYATCLYDCKGGRPARAVGGVHASLGDGIRKLPTPAESAGTLLPSKQGHLSPISCDCAARKLSMDAEHSSNCQHKRIFGQSRASAACWKQCCRPEMRFPVAGWQ